MSMQNAHYKAVCLGKDASRRALGGRVRRMEGDRRHLSPGTGSSERRTLYREPSIRYSLDQSLYLF